MLHPATERTPFEVFAAKNPNEQIRRESSSGGVFTQLAEQTIEAGGVVFGVKWNEHFEAVHAYAETKEELAAFRGSKYVQSRVGEAYLQAERFLKQGRQVLFSGTPCQIAALRLFLRKDYDNLLAVDFICHGTPSPGVFRWYLGEELEQAAARQSGEKIQFRSSLPAPSIAKADVLAGKAGYEIKDIRFRDKRAGWKKYSFVLSLKSLSKATAAGEKNSVSLSYTLDRHAFMRGFLCDLYLRPSCHACPAKAGRSGADITLGDYWGISSLMPELDDDRGISALTVNTEKGRRALHSTNAELHAAPYDDLCRKNPALVHSARIPSGRAAFFAETEETFHRRIRTLCRVSLKRRIRNKVAVCLSRVMGRKTKQFLKQILRR